MEPGMLMSVKMRSMSLRFSRIRVASSASQTLRTSQPAARSSLLIVDEGFVLDPRVRNATLGSANLIPRANAAPSPTFQWERPCRPLKARSGQFYTALHSAFRCFAGLLSSAGSL
jgi:hypothetical protein